MKKSASFSEDPPALVETAVFSTEGTRPSPASSDKVLSSTMTDGVLKEVHRTLPFWRCFLDLKQRYSYTPVIETIKTSILYRVPCKVFDGVEVVWAVSKAVLRVQTGPCKQNVLQQRREKRRRSGEESKRLTPLQCHKGWEEWWWGCALPNHSDKTTNRAQEGIRSPTSFSSASSSFPLSSSSTATPHDAAFPRGSAACAGLTFSSTSCSSSSSLLRGRKIKSWRGVPSTLRAFHLGTLHFVHENATAADEKSFHIQSVFLYDQPYRLQCVAGMMIHFAFVLYSSAQVRIEAQQSGRSVHSLWKEITQQGSSMATASTSTGSFLKNERGEGDQKEKGENKVEVKAQAMVRERSTLASKLLFPPTTHVLILGMGGNTMAVALRAALGPQALLHVVEIEPAVVSICESAGTVLKDDPYYHVFLEDAKTFLEQCNSGRAARQPPAPAPGSASVQTERLPSTSPSLSPFPPASPSSKKSHRKKSRWKEPARQGSSKDQKEGKTEDSESTGNNLLDPEKERTSTNHEGLFTSTANPPCEGYHLVFLDLFEPLTARMVEEGGSILQLCHAALSVEDGGLLIANEHQLPDPKRLAPLTKLFGDGHVHAVNVRGWKESVVVGWKAPYKKKGCGSDENQRKNWDDKKGVEGEEEGDGENLGRCSPSPPHQSPSVSEVAPFYPSTNHLPSSVATTPSLVDAEPPLGLLKVMDALEQTEEIKKKISEKEKEEEERWRKISLSCSMHVAKVVQSLYDRHLQGILPDVSTWLRSVSTCGKAPHRCRVWES